MLPKIEYQLSELTIPSTQQKVFVRPMLAKDEKLLMMAKLDDKGSDVFSSIRQVVNNCIVEPIVDIDTLALFDLEYLFIRLRAISVFPTIKVSYEDNEDHLPYEFEVKLNDITVKYPENVSKEITVEGHSNLILHLQYPKASLYNNEEFKALEGKDVLDYLLKGCIKTVQKDNGETYFNVADSKEQNDFLQSLPILTYQKLREFLNNMPSVYYEIEYTNSLGKERKIVMNTLSDFFMF